MTKTNRIDYKRVMNGTLTRAARKQLRKIPEPQRSRIYAAISTMCEEWPQARNVKNLVGREGMRLRVGDYRVLFTADTETIIISEVKNAMNEHTENALRGRSIVHGPGGEAQYVLVPVLEYLELVDTGVVLGPDGEVLDVPDSVTIPVDVAKAVDVDDKTMLRAWREHLGLTQADVAERMGVTKAAYSQMERGHEKLRIDTLKRIALAFGVGDWRKLVE